MFFLDEVSNHIADEAKFQTLKKEALKNIKSLFGENSRHYRVVELTKSPATIAKVMNHISGRTATLKQVINM